MIGVESVRVKSAAMVRVNDRRKKRISNQMGISLDLVNALAKDFETTYQDAFFYLTSANKNYLTKKQSAVIFKNFIDISFSAWALAAKSMLSPESNVKAVVTNKLNETLKNFLI